MNSVHRILRGRFSPFAAFGLLLIVAWMVYLPGLSGPFLFDDYSNLPPLGDFGPIHSFWKAVAWITSGFAGPTGRPVALASFLMDARDWPVPPEAFKQTNVLIHLVNGVLLAGLVSAIARGFALGGRQSLWVGVLAAGLWLLHPFWVSTTLYVVQRMAMLAALFVFAGLWAYAHGRLQLQRGREASAFAWMSLGLGLGTLLAVLSKENGALLPLLAWVLEAFVFDRDARALDRCGVRFLWWRRVFIILPSLVVLGYMFWQLPMLLSSQTYGRDFTPIQRLLTEARIIWGYLGALWMPGTHMGGLFNDDILISRSLFRPPVTFLAILGLFAMAVFAAISRVYARSAFWRSVGLAIAFFLLGHLLESTWLPLELSFEHRNYLPAGLMFLPIGILLVEKWRDCRTTVLWVTITLMLLLSLLTVKRADLWGKPFQQALVWAHEHPNSPRAQSYAANFWTRVGNYPQAISLLDHSMHQHPNSLLLLANRAMLSCAVGDVSTRLKAALIHLASQGRLDQTVTGYQFDRLLQSLSKGCAGFGKDAELHLIAAALKNPHAAENPNELRSLLHRRALYWLAHGDPQRALRDYSHALRLKNLQPGVRLRFATELASREQPRLALKLLNTVPSPLANIRGWSMPAIHMRWLRHVHFYRDAEAHLRAELEKEVGMDGGAS